MTGITEALSYPFMQRALAAGVLLALVSSFYGVFIVQRGMSFMGDGLAHAAFGGVALGLLLGHEPLWVAIPFTVLVALGITFVKRRTSLTGDTAIGIFFSVSAALGIVFLSLRKEFSAEAYTYLFGSILAVTPADLWVAAGLALITLCISPLWRRWAYATFDRELSLADRLPVQQDDYLLSVLIAVCVVVAVKVVGIVLIAAFLVIPAASARLVTRRLRSMTAVAMVASFLSVLGGLLASYYVDVPSGATIILVQAAGFSLAFICRRRGSGSSR